MIHEVLPVGLLQCNCSILGDEQSGEAMVIDPGDQIQDVLAVVTRHGLRVTSIVITHAHIDHIGGAQKLRAATGAPVYMNERDQFLNEQLEMQASWLGIRTSESVEIDKTARDGDRLMLNTAEVLVLHTPGHTPGSLCLWIPSEKKLIAGDTLFRDSIGRTDLPGGDSRQILVSIHDKLLPLPEDAVVFPGHGESTTMGREKNFNYFLQRL